MTKSLNPGELSEALIRLFANSKINMILCYSKIVKALLQDSAELIGRLHDNRIGGFEGFHQTTKFVNDIFGLV